MGYYDNHTSQPKKRGGYFATGLSGVLAGTMLVGVLIPSVTDADFSAKDAVQTEAVQSVAGLEQVATTVTTDVTEVVEKASPAVVGVTNLQTVQNTSPFGQTTGSGEAAEAGTGSGVVYKKEGGSAYIITNHHVVDGAEQVKVTLSDGTELEAELLGSDPWTDLAVLKVDESAVTAVAEIGDSSVLKTGEPVIAIGNPLGLQFSGSVTTGVVSGKERLVPMDINQDGLEDWQAEVLQTDAAINPGNSGGALLNSSGQLIGINSMKIAEASVEGIGFAIPVNAALPIVEALETEGTVSRPSLGVSVMGLEEVPQPYRERDLNLPEEVTEGVVVESVQAGSGADKAGIEQLDLIVGINGTEIGSLLELRQYLYNEAKTGDTLSVELYRDGELMTVNVELIENLQQ